MKNKKYSIRFTPINTFGEWYIDVKASSDKDAVSKAFKKIKKSDFLIEIMKVSEKNRDYTFTQHL